MRRIYISIVVATSSRYKLLEKLLKSLQDQTYPYYEIILICIRADSKIRELSIKYGAKLLEDGGRGRCYARNLGIKEAKGEIVVFLDDDVVLEKDWLELIVKDLNLNLHIGGVGGLPVSIKDHNKPSNLAFYDIIYDLMINKAEGLHGFQGWQGKNRFYTAKVEILSGANMAFRRDALFQIGGFDENFYGPSLGEDADLCLRVIEKGYWVILDPKAKAYHYSDHIQRWLTFHKNHPDFFFALADNQTYWHVKHQLIRGLKWLPYMLFRFVVAFYFMLKTRNLKIFFSYIKGIFKGRIRGKFWSSYSLKQDKLKNI